MGLVEGKAMQTHPDELNELLKRTAKDSKAFIESFQSKITGDQNEERTLFFSQEEAFNLIEKQIDHLKKKRALKDFCKENKINYSSLNTLRHNIKSHPNASKAPNLILQLLRVLYKNVELQKEIYYKVTVEVKKGG